GAFRVVPRIVLRAGDDQHLAVAEEGRGDRIDGHLVRQGLPLSDELRGVGKARLGPSLRGEQGCAGGQQERDREVSSHGNSPSWRGVGANRRFAQASETIAATSWPTTRRSTCT